MQTCLRRAAVPSAARALAKRGVSSATSALAASTFRRPALMHRPNLQQHLLTPFARSILAAAPVRSFSSIDSLGVVDGEAPETPAASSNILDNASPLDDFDLDPQVRRNLLKAGMTSLFPVQAQTFTLVNEGKDLIAKSPTGSGKTLAFVLPIVNDMVQVWSCISGAFLLAAFAALHKVDSAWNVVVSLVATERRLWRTR